MNINFHFLFFFLAHGFHLFETGFITSVLGVYYFVFDFLLYSLLEALDILSRVHVVLLWVGILGICWPSWDVCPSLSPTLCEFECFNRFGTRVCFHIFNFTYMVFPVINVIRSNHLFICINLVWFIYLYSYTLKCIRHIALFF